MDDRGYILAVLLIGMAISAVWMAALLPSWRHQAQREKETELIFRGEQYARAIALYRAKNNGNLPQNLDVLLSQKYLRKKYLDPITGEEFTYLGAMLPGQTSSTQPSLANAPRAGSTSTTVTTGQANPTGQPGIYGVQSKSTAASIKVYQGQQQHNLWPFTWQLAAMRGVGGAPAGNRGGNRGGPARGGEDSPIRPGTPGASPGGTRGPGPGGRPGGAPGGVNTGRGGGPVRSGGGGPGGAGSNLGW